MRLHLVILIVTSSFISVENLEFSSRFSYVNILIFNSQFNTFNTEQLLEQGDTLYKKHQHQAALRTYFKVLEVYQANNNHQGEAKVLQRIGATYRQLEQYSQAHSFYNRALALYQKTGNRKREASVLNSLGIISQLSSEYSQAIDFYHQALVIRRDIQDRRGEGRTINNLGIAHFHQGQYVEALDFYEQALLIFESLDDRTNLGAIFNNIGLVQSQLGQYEKALEFYDRALRIRKQLDDRSGMGTTLHNIGFVYRHQNQPERALEYYQQAIALRTQIDDRAGEAQTLNNMGEVYGQLTQYDRAMASLERALAIFQEIHDRVGEGDTLDSFGKVYASLGQHSQALRLYQQSIAIQHEINNRAGESTTLNNIAQLLEQQNKPQLAILFYKQSVNITETIRQDLRQLPVELQQSYTATVADTYRNLADLLLQQNRILEAQRVLDLLKIQELQDYLQDVRGNPNTTQGIPNTPPEGQIWTSYQDLTDRAIPLGRELAQLRQLDTRTPAQDERIAQLVAAQQELARNFNAFIESPEVLSLVEQLSPATRKPDLADDLEDLLSLQDNLRNLNQNAVLFYPLILEDRLELILVAPDSPPIRRTVEVTRAELNAAILEFRRRLQNPTRDATKVAQQLYTWLVKPLENDLTAAEAETLIYAPDGQLRYIPLAALHDGRGWLVERFRINNITAASLTDLNSQPQGQLEILAGAFASVSYPVKVGEEEFVFRALPYAGKEVEALVATLPNTTSLIDAAFSRDATIPQMDNYTVVHFATHGAFVVGSPQDSFIIFGDGEIATLAEIKNWSLRNVDLVVLSACQTGLGGELGNGDEILGLGYQFQRAGARAAIASLWAVDDGGTQVLMQGFYEALQQEGATKAEALRQAQLALIGLGVEVAGEEERGLVAVRSREELEPEVADRLSHPYYWAPFILIGNGL